MESSLEARFAALEAEVRELRAELAARPPASGPPAPAGESLLDAPTSRRRMLLGGAAAGAAAVAAATIAGAPPAAATTGTMQFGAANDAGATATSLTSTVSGNTLTIKNTGDGFALRAEATGIGVYGRTTGAYGVLGQADSGVGVNGYSNDSSGLYGTSVNGDGGYVTSTNGPALRLGGGRTHLRFSTSGQLPPPNRSVAHQAGDVVLDNVRDLWVCTAAGTPGTWRKVGGGTTAGAFHVLPAPARVYDSRGGTAPAQGPTTKLSGNVARTIDLKVNSSGVPAGATAALLTVLLVDAFNGNGNMTVWANGVTRPAANTMVWGAGSGRYTTSTVTGLDANAQCQISASAATNVVLDVVGYYR